MIFFQVFDYSILFLSILPVTLASAWTGSKKGTLTASSLVIYNVAIIYFTGHYYVFFDSTFIGSSALTILLAWMVGKIKDVNTELNKELDRRKRIENELSKSKKRVKKLHDIATELESCREKEDVYKLTIKAAKEILDFDICKILVIQKDKMVVKETSKSSDADEFESIQLHDSIAGKTYLKKESMLFENIEDDEFNELEGGKYRSLITIPIGDEAVFQAGCNETENIEEGDIEVLELLCNHATEALKRLKMIEKEEFLHSLLRHDVRTKVNIVKRYLDLIDEYDLPQEVEEHLDKANKVIQKSDDLTEKIKTLSKVKEEKIIDVNAAEALQSAIERNKGLASEKGMKIESNLFEFHVKGGPLLEELFTNLIENCLKHSEGDIVKVSIEESKYKANIIIEDDGIGIPPERREKIFKKGYKKGENSGSGLGMYMVKKIAKNYGAKVKITDSELGGTRFELPLEKADK